MGHLDQRESTSAFVGGGFEVDLLGSVSHVFHYWLRALGSSPTIQPNHVPLERHRHCCCTIRDSQLTEDMDQV
jgi:hypothetical protein